jgi:hypothetical protein
MIPRHAEIASAFRPDLRSAKMEADPDSGRESRGLDEGLVISARRGESAPAKRAGEIAMTTARGIRIMVRILLAAKPGLMRTEF